MDTPGFEEENKSKPKITKEIEGASTPVSPESAAKDLLGGMLSDRYFDIIRFYITNDMLGELARVSVNGGQPRPNLMMETLASPLLAIIFTVWSIVTDKDIVTHFKKKQ